MIRAIIALVAIALQVFYYLTLFKVIETDFFVSIWNRLIVIVPSYCIGYCFMDMCVVRMRKWMRNVIYAVMMACATIFVLHISRVYLGLYTFSIVFVTIYPLIYGAWIYFDYRIESDSWYFIKQKCRNNPISNSDNTKAFGQTDVFQKQSCESVRALSREHGAYSRELLRYVQGEFETLKKYILGETTLDRLNIIIEQPTQRAYSGEEIPINLENPCIYCDGTRNAILVYNSEHTYGLDYMHRNVYERVNELNSILVMEVKLDLDKSEIVRQFYVPIMKVNMSSTD